MSLEGTQWIAGQQAQGQRNGREIQMWTPLPQPSDQQSTYSSHYQKWPLPPRNTAIRPKDNRPTTAATFDTRSTMQDSYQPWGPGRIIMKSCRPTSAYDGPTGWLQPLSTTHREAFQKWPAIRQQAFKPKSQREANPNADAPTGRSTAQDSYQPWGPGRIIAKSAQPVEKPVHNVHKFEGTTTMRASFQPWPIPARHGRIKPPENKFMGGEGADNMPFPQSTYRDMFREMKVMPMKKKSVGVQVVGGKFYTMLPMGTVPPAVKKVMMTTTTGRQASMDIVVVECKDNNQKAGQIIGEFTLDGIVPSAAGVPQIEVSFVYSNDYSLRVSANDLQGNRTRALSVKNKIYLG